MCDTIAHCVTTTLHLDPAASAVSDRARAESCRWPSYAEQLAGFTLRNTALADYAAGSSMRFQLTSWKNEKLCPENDSSTHGLKLVRCHMTSRCGYLG